MKEVAPAARRRDARLSFAFVYPDRRGRNVIRNVYFFRGYYFAELLCMYSCYGVFELMSFYAQVGLTYANGSRRGGDDLKTLADLSFQVCWFF